MRSYPTPTVLLIGCMASCGAGDGGTSAPQAAGEPWFRECAAESGIDFAHVSGHADRFYMPEIMGGGAALFDADGDGDLDAYLVQSGSILPTETPGPPNRLYLNDGSGQFTDVTEGSGADDRGYGMGVATGDFDADGDVDLYVTNVGANVLLSNEGEGRFRDVTASAGVGDAGWGVSAAFFDADRDGDLDLFVTNYLQWTPGGELECRNEQSKLDYCSPQVYQAPIADVLYLNEGDGSFRDASQSSGIGAVPGTGLGVVCADFDEDGLPDVFVANDGMPDRLWTNLGDGRFEDRGSIAGCAVDNDGRPKAGMGISVADIDDDGDLDLLVGNLNRQSDSLYRNDGQFFVDVSARLGLGMVSRPYTRFGMGWQDFDNDGWLDLYEANGRVALQWSVLDDDPFAEPNLLLRGSSSGRFEEVLPRGGTVPELVATSRAAAFGDVDGDGGVDVLVVNRDGPAHLLRNLAAAGEGWISFELVEAEGRSAIGARVTARVGDRTIRRDVRTAYSYLAANDPRVHIGLGSAAGVQDVTVRWADGTEQAFGDLDAGRVHRLVR